MYIGCFSYAGLKIDICNPFCHSHWLAHEALFLLSHIHIFNIFDSILIYKNSLPGFMYTVEPLFKVSPGIRRVEH
jgi:hypothetical protein